MPMNPITGNVSQPAAFDFVSQAETTRDRTELKPSQEHGGLEVKAFHADVPDIADRSGGAWGGWARVIGFGVANFLTVGIVGKVGHICANSSIMGSQKGGVFKEFFKDWGQTYRNSTQINPGDSGFAKTMKWLGKGWSNFMPGAWIGHAVVLGQNVHYNRSVNQEFGNAVQREFGANLNYNSVKDLNNKTAFQSKKLMYQHLNAELQSADNRPRVGDYRSSAARLATYSGTPSLKAAFANHAENVEKSPENAPFLAWSSATLEKLDPNSDYHDPNYQLSKKELVTLKNDFIRDNGPYGINLSYQTRPGVWNNLGHMLNVHNNDNYEQRLILAQNAVKQNPDDPVAKSNLERIENEQLSAQDSQRLLPTLKKADDEIYRLVSGDTLRRFKVAIHTKAESLGVTPNKLEKKAADAKSTLSSLRDDEKKLQKDLEKAQKQQKLAQMNLDEKPNDQWLQRELSIAKDNVKEIQDELNEVQKLVVVANQETVLTQAELNGQYRNMVHDG